MILAPGLTHPPQKTEFPMAENRRPLVVSVILNTNRRDDTLECLRSLGEGDYLRLETIVLDNASTDGSAAAIRNAYPAVRLIALQENRGYAGNNNVGIEAALGMGAKWVLVMNEDVVVAPDAVSRMVEVGEADPRIGVVGPMVYHWQEPEVIQSAGGALDRGWRSRHEGQNEPDRGQYREPRPVDWISGCALLARREMIQEVGSLDSRFFYYWEETDWCLRARRAGWRVVAVPAAHIWHKGVQRHYHPGADVTYYSTRNRLLMLGKHRAPVGAWLAASTEMARTLLAWTVRPKWRSMRSHRDAMWQGMTDFLRRRWGRRPDPIARAERRLVP
jgi:GT2 family glycosyltransferase